ncbi:hypothetical protein RB596_001279 [Gaeumannomyces avenae]
MPAFTSINDDREENVLAEEFDNTRQIQIDDSLKLFQQALKLHAQGPKFYDDAAAAYRSLFDSAIFKFPEATTEYERAHGSQTPLLPPGTAFIPTLDIAGRDGDLGSSLLQGYYLAYKNHGHFRLDRIRHKARTAGGPEASRAVFAQEETQSEALDVLGDFNAALDRDPSDAEMWRRVARVSAFLKSARLSRYCLEAAIELDDDPAVVDVEPPSLAEGYAGEQLKNQLKVLGDEMALSHPIMGPYIKGEMATVLKRYLDPLPYLPNPIKVLGPAESSTNDTEPRQVLDLKIASWTELGKALVAMAMEKGISGQAITIQMPELPEEDRFVQMEVDSQLQDQVEAQVQEESANAPVSNHESDTPKTAESAGSKTKAENTPAAKDSAQKDSGPIAPPLRKRSQSEAGLPEPGEEENGDSKRPKRARRRETAAEESIDPTRLIATQLQPFQAADANLFQMTKNILENLGVVDKGAFDRISEMLDSCASEDRLSKITSQVARDLWTTIDTVSAENAKLVSGKLDTPALGLNAFLEHTKSGSVTTSEIPVADETIGLKAFVKRMNEGWFSIQDCAFEWILSLCQSYSESRWSEQRKVSVVQVISRMDEAIYQRTVHQIQVQAQKAGPLAKEHLPVEHLVQMLFELHLDVYERITNPSSVVDEATRKDTKLRLGRWLNLRSQLFQEFGGEARDRLSLRFCWAVVFSTTLEDSAMPDHILLSWQSMREVLEDVGEVDIRLPNNVVMPEVSLKAVDREISKLTTMDFFLSLFQEEMDDPVSVISNLEPVLNSESVMVPTSTAAAGGSPANGEGHDDNQPRQDAVPVTECATQTLKDLWKFLRGSGTELRLFLWRRLGDAYQAIKYTTKKFSCLLKAIEMIVNDFARDTYVDSSAEARTGILVLMLKNLDELLVDALTLALNDNTSFDVIDEQHLTSISAALAKLSCILHVCAIYDDEVGVGLRQSGDSNSGNRKILLEKLREFQSRTWCLQYTVMKVGIQQNKTLFTDPSNDLAELLGAIHQVLGLRKACKASNKIFLKMMRVELLKQDGIEHWEDYLAQVLYDLHGLKLGVGSWEVEEHGCPSEKLEKRAAINLVEKITTLANRMSMKDLLKSELKTTIEHVQQAIGQAKSTPQMIHNLRNFTEYLKKPIHPLRLYQAWKGTVSIDAVTVTTTEAGIAKHGWFFLLGMIAFSKFKQVDLNRRQTPGATDDLRIGQAFLRNQIQFTPDRWDAWLRLAECFDYELDEAVLWTADKINKDRAELLKFQRSSIHCYSLALSHSCSMSRVLSENDTEALFDLYYNFGMRMYASSREPFGMEPFKHAELERFFIEHPVGTYKKIIHMEMTAYQVWKFAANLFRKAAKCRPKDWKSPYMYSKCLWKMYQTPDDDLQEKIRLTKPTKEDLVQSLEKSVEVVSLLPKPRHGQDPILEPHYKLLTILYKLVARGDTTAQEAANILQRQPHALRRGEEILIGDSDDAEDWDEFIIKYLRQLRDKDKSNWQHRMIIRHARILFDADESSGAQSETDANGGTLMQAKAAFSVLRESMFTKTMVMNVWKCDAERPGRHHVYTEQYVRFMTRLLLVMNDRVNMEALLRRIRKKGVDFYHFNELWQSCVLAYVGQIRQAYQITETTEETFKSTNMEEFEIMGERISEWAGKATAQHAAFDAMKEAIELKKLNTNLTKAAPIDDLISDCYSRLYTEIAPDLPGQPPAQIIEERQQKTKEAAEKNAEEEMDGPRPSGLDGFLFALDTRNSSRAGSEVPDRADRSTIGGEHTARPRRAAGVRRPDILRKAEQAVQRALEPPPKSAVSVSSRGDGGRKSRVGSTSSGRHSRATPNPDATAQDDDEDEDQNDVTDHENAGDGDGDGGGDVEMKDGDDDEEAIDETIGADISMVTGEDDVGADGGSERSSSPRGSLHDSADDESDLSDVPDDYEINMPPSLMFPNLHRSLEPGPIATSESEDPASPMDEDERENEEEGEGDEDEGPEEDLGEDTEDNEDEDEELEDADEEGEEEGHDDVTNNAEDEVDEEEDEDL